MKGQRGSSHMFGVFSWGLSRWFEQSVLHKAERLKYWIKSQQKEQKSHISSAFQAALTAPLIFHWPVSQLRLSPCWQTKFVAFGRHLHRSRRYHCHLCKRPGGRAPIDPRRWERLRPSHSRFSHSSEVLPYRLQRCFFTPSIRSDHSIEVERNLLTPQASVRSQVHLQTWILSFNPFLYRNSMMS